MTEPVTESHLDEAVARAFGRHSDTPMTTTEAAQDAALAAAFGRDPDPRALEARRHVQAAQEAERTVYPWRSAVRWDQRDEVLQAEEQLAQLASSRRGQSKAAAREYVSGLLREAWAKGGTTDHDRMVAVAKALSEGISHFSRLAPIAGTVESTGAPGRTSIAPVTEADVDEAIARAFGRDRKEGGA